MRLENEKTSRKAPGQHPHGEDISAYLDGMLDIRKMRNIAQHIGSCPECNALHQSLRQVKFRLGELPTPQSPVPEFWQNAYRELRVQSGQRQSWIDGLRESMESHRSRTRRRVAVGFAVAALACGALATPLLMNSPASEAPSTVSADVVDLSSLVRAHAQYAASQPLSDPDRQTMISADTDDARAIAPAALEMGAALRQIQPISWAFVVSGALLLFATAASPKHSHRLARPAQTQVSQAAAKRQTPSARPVAAKPRIPTAATLYLKSLHADKLYSYRGRQTTTYWRPGRSESVIVSHRAPNLRRIDYLAPDVERGRCVVITDAQQWQYDPGTKQLLHRRIQPGGQAAADAAASYDLLRANYVVGVERTIQNSANCKAFVLTITRKSNRTLARKLWIDAATGLVLKRENYGQEGKLALTEAYSDINYHIQLSKKLFDLSAIAHRPGVKLTEEPAASETLLKIGAVKHELGGEAHAPSTLNGYRLISASLTRDGRHDMLHLRYSDGLNLVSLYEQRRTEMRRPTRVPKSMRPTQIGRRAGHIARVVSITTLNWDTRLLNITLMSEVGEETLRSLAFAVDPPVAHRQEK